MRPALLLALGASRSASAAPTWINDILKAREYEYLLSYRQCWADVTQGEVARCCSARDAGCFDGRYSPEVCCDAHGVTAGFEVHGPAHPKLPPGFLAEAAAACAGPEGGAHKE